MPGPRAESTISCASLSDNLFSAVAYDCFVDNPDGTDSGSRRGSESVRPTVAVPDEVVRLLESFDRGEPRSDNFFRDCTTF